MGRGTMLDHTCPQVAGFIAVPPALLGWEGASSLPNILLVGGAVLIMAFILLRLRQRHHDPAGAPNRLSLEEQIQRRRQTRGLEQDVERLAVEVEQMAHRVSAQLDAKALQLEKLVREADARLAELRQLQQTTAAVSTPPTPEADPAPPVEPPAPPTLFTPPPTPAPQPAARSHKTNPPPAQTPLPPPDPAADPLAASVYALADRGLDAAAIAQQLHEHVGKVELILALRQA